MEKESAWIVFWKIKHDSGYAERFMQDHKDSLLLDRLLVEINLANELITDSDAFCIDVMQWHNRIERMSKGYEEIPDIWIQDYWERKGE